MRIRTGHGAFWPGSAGSNGLGTPVVGVSEGGVKESVLDKQTGILVERDVEEFADAIQQLILQPDLAREYGQNGRAYVEQNWTWEQSTERISKYLAAAAAGNPGAATAVRSANDIISAR